MSAFFIKENEYKYRLCAIIDMKICTLSFMVQGEYDFMLEHFQKMLDSNNLPYIYTFPSCYERSMTFTQLMRKSFDEYQLSSNFHYVHSDMDNEDFIDLLAELKEFPKQAIGSKMYFVPRKDDNE